jgi:hypothetical protein
MKNKQALLNHFFNFLAVILGVYLAFYINERAQIAQDRKESALLMQSLVADLTGDLNIYEAYQIPENAVHQKNVETLFAMVSSNQMEGINNQLPTILQVENYAPTTSTYSAMKSSGKLRLIEDPALRKALAGYYEGLVPESIRKGEFQVDYFTGEVLTWLTRNADLAEMQVLNTAELTEFSNKLIIYGSLIDQKVEAYKTLVEESGKLKSSLEAALGSKE